MCDDHFEEKEEEEEEYLGCINAFVWGEYHQSLQEEHQELMMMIKKNQRERERECSLEKIRSSTTQKLKLLCETVQ